MEENNNIPEEDRIHVYVYNTGYLQRVDKNTISYMDNRCHDDGGFCVGKIVRGKLQKYNDPDANTEEKLARKKIHKALKEAKITEGIVCAEIGGNGDPTGIYWAVKAFKHCNSMDLLIKITEHYSNGVKISVCDYNTKP